jgi:hypothetical protein
MSTLDATPAGTIIAETTITFTILHPSDEPVSSIEEALMRSMSGNAVGLETAIVTRNVADSDVEERLLALGSEETFFDLELGRDRG